MSDWIDLRSDTVTRPTRAMRRAMAEAEVGDDVYGEDATVNRLEELAAEKLGHQAGLFVPTGTMGNTIAIKLLTRHGQEVICDSRCHILNYELSMMAWFCGCVARPIATSDGRLSWSAIEREFRPLGPHWAPTGAIEIENTHNMAGGTVYPLEATDEICDKAHARGLRVHLDGARIFNAATRLGVEAARIAAKADTVMFCLSKALGAPSGSVLVGSRELIEEGRLLRKRLGGGMRQVGVLAAPGLIALREMPARLVEDHENARLLAGGLAAIPTVALDPAAVETNIVIFDVSRSGLPASEISRRLRERGVLINAISPVAMRAVTHYDVDRAGCRKAVEALGQVLAAVAA